MIYLQTTVQLAGPAKVLEFEEVLGGKFSPYLEKLGAKFVGSWFTLVGPQSEVTDLWCFDNAAHYEEVMQKVMMDPEAIPLMATLSPLIVKETTKLMYPLPCSPLK